MSNTSIFDYGAAGDGVADDSAAFAAAIAALAADDREVVKTIDLHGQTFAVSQPVKINAGAYIRLSGGKLKAIGFNWTASGFLLEVSTKGSGAQHLHLDSDGLCSGLKITGNRTVFHDVEQYHQHASGIGIHVAGGSSTECCLVKSHQWLDGEWQRVEQSYRTARGWVIDTADGRFERCIGAWTYIPLTIESGAHHCRFTACHFYNGRGADGEPHIHPVNIIVKPGSYANLLLGTYIDNGYLDLYETAIAVIGSQYLTSSNRATLTSHVRIFATSADDYFDPEFRYTDNRHSSALPRAVELYANGFNWAASVHIEDYVQSIDMIGTPKVIASGAPQSAVLKLLSSHARAFLQFIGLGTTNVTDIGADGNDLVLRTNGTDRIRIYEDGAVKGLRWARVGQNTGTVIGAAHDHCIVSIDQSGGAQTFSLDNGAPAGTSVRIVQRGASTVTVKAETGAFLDGVAAGSLALTRHKMREFTVHRNSNGASAEWCAV